MNKEYQLDVIESSRRSLRKFIKLFVGINHTDYWFHQTLTFKEKIHSKGKAKKYLKKLLDALEKKYPEMAAVWVMGYQKRHGLHFHVIFLFFGQQPISREKMREKFGGEVFRHWCKVNEKKPERKANQINFDKLGRDWALDYLLRKQNIQPASKLKRTIHWHGVRRGKIIDANSHPVSKKEVTEAYLSIYPKPAKPAPARPRHFTRRDIREQKKFMEDYGKDWESLKKGILKTDKKVSDENYRRFQNGEKNIMKSRKFNPKTDLF